MIIFSNEKARNQLIRKGEVITIRQHRRDVGRDWATANRGEPKLCNVYITLLKKYENKGPLTPEEIQQHVGKSGFATPEEWLRATSYYFGKKGIYRAWIYHVRKLKNGHSTGTLK